MCRWGSNAYTRPYRDRAAAVATSTSGLVEVTSAAPGAHSTEGMMTAEVLPRRGGPRTRQADSAGAWTTPKSAWMPMNAPPPRPAASARTASNPSTSGSTAPYSARRRAERRDTVMMTSSAMTASHVGRRASHSPTATCTSPVATRRAIEGMGTAVTNAPRGRDD